MMANLGDQNMINLIITFHESYIQFIKILYHILVNYYSILIKR